MIYVGTGLKWQKIGQTRIVNELKSDDIHDKERER